MPPWFLKLHNFDICAIHWIPRRIGRLATGHQAAPTTRERWGALVAGHQLRNPQIGFVACARTRPRTLTHAPYIYDSSARAVRSTACNCTPRGTPPSAVADDAGHPVIGSCFRRQSLKPAGSTGKVNLIATAC